MRKAVHFVIAAWGIGSCFGCCHHPTDAELLKRFEAQRPQIERLVADFRGEPGFLRIVRLDDEAYGIAPERNGYYQRQLRELELLEVGTGGKDVTLVVSTCPFPFPSLKGYRYCKRSLLRTVADLDRAQSRDLDEAYRHIEGNWYLYYSDGGGS